MVARALMTLSRMIPTCPLLFIDSERKVLYRGYNTPKSCAIDCSNMATRKTRIMWSNEKRSSVPWGLRVPIWKINFFSGVLRLSELPRRRERPQWPI